MYRIVKRMAVNVLQAGNTRTKSKGFIVCPASAVAFKI